MAALQAELKSWTANRIGDLTQTRDSDCLEIAECILENEDLADPEALKAWLSPFVTEESAKHKADSFVEALFERKAQIALLQSNPQGAAGGEGAKGKSKDGKGGAKGGRGRGEKDEDRGKGKSGKGEKQRVLPTMDMPFLPRREGDKRLMVVDASSGRHNVLTNCLNCGKVITEQEGWGPCLFCGNPLEVGDRRTGIKRGDERGRIDMDGRPAGDDEERYNASFQRAVATKDRLLSYDRDAKRRTKVYDDATDWYSEAANPWLSEKQREEAKAKGQDEERRRREERRKIHATIDIFGRTVIDTSADVEANMKKKDREAFQEWTEGTTKNQRLLKMLEEQRGIGGANAQMSDESQKLYERLRAALHAAGTGKCDKGYESLKATKDAGMEGRTTRSWNVSGGDRVEDEFSAVTLRDFQGSERPLLPAEESPYGDAEDAGQCLSMHQPWASLLVYGFKRAEGRSWSTEHRGRLWIHATSKAPDPDEVATLEERYRDIYESAGVPIPPLPSKSGGYPTSALLGCVDLEACWTQVEYASVLARNPSMPQEESQSEHVFWCLRPRRLLVPLKMGGDHKIWKLEKSALTPAQRGLQPVRWPVPEEGESNIVSPVLA